jgi:pimeloyl-ACP methyl ester carboxylesterase
MSEPLRRRPHLGLDLAKPREGPGLVVMDLPPRSPLAGRVAVGARLRAIDDHPIDDLDAARDRIRALRAGDACVVRFDSGTVRCVLEELPLEPMPHGRVELGEVDCGAFRLRSIWTFPKGAGPFPVVWLQPSANWLSEEHTQELWHPTLKLVQALTRLGLATLRVDRSGLGDSGGPPCVDADLETELGWCRAAHAHLLAHPRVDRARVHLFGRSLGGTLVQLLAHELAPRAAAVWGATAIPWHDAMMRATRRQRRLAGMAGSALEAYLAKRERISRAVLIDGELPRDVLAREPALAEARGEYEGTRVHGRDARFFQQLEACDVAGACARYEGPLLVMRGELDWITSEEDAASVVAAARAPTFRAFPGIDHLMHRRESLEEAFAHTFGGDFDPGGAEAIAAFFRRDEGT